MIRHSFAAALALLVATLAASAEERPKLKGLLIAGGCCHDYERQNKIITEGLSQRMSVAWDVHFGENKRELKLDVYKKPNWSQGYDLVVHNECYGDMSDAEFVEGIVKEHVEKGVPAVMIHCSMHTYRNAATDEWRKLLGVTSRRHEKGGRRLDVKNLAPEHPIMRGFPEMWKTPNGELYVIENLWPNCTPLASAYGEDTRQDQVCIWTNTYGKTRVFGTTLGHHNETMMAPEWLDTVARGALWTLGKLQDDGSPAPGFAGTGAGPLSFERPEDPAQQPTPARRRPAS